MKESEIRKAVADTILEWRGIKGGSEGHKQILEIYNSQKKLPRGYKMSVNDAWCAATVCAVWILNGIDSYMDMECSCNNLIENAKKVGWWIEDDSHVPGIGDAVMYDWDDSGIGDNVGRVEHVGLVIDVDYNGILQNNEITVIEGNKNNEVGLRYIQVNNRYIRGFICPRYDLIAKDRTEHEKLNKYQQWAVDTGIFKGDGNGNYKWDEPIFRKDLCAVLYRYLEVIK